MAKEEIFTSEAGLRGHPDKVCDEIGDAVLDAYLAQDQFARVGCGAMVARDLILIGGQIKSRGQVDIEALTRDVIREIGYTTEGMGFDYKTCEIILRVDPQDPSIAQAVDAGGAGDSGIMFGYACEDTPERMPLPASLVHDIAKHIDQLHKANDLTGFGPDGKIQASVRYKDGKPEYIDNLIISVQHSATIDYEELCNHLKSSLLATVIPDRFVSGETHFLFRAKVGFIDGGPKSDCGLSGRKVISDTYGSWARHGGGGLSGKDPSKIDRCATYAARYMAKNLVAAGLAERCEVQLAYMIGLNEPLAVSIDFQGTGKVSEDRALDAVKQIFPLEPEDIIQQLRLRRPIYRKAGIYGHFGHTDPDFSWERTDRVDDILQRLA